jgi:hypothetical protein
MEVLTVETRRAEIERGVERVLRDHIPAEHRRTWPDEQKRADYRDCYVEFALWCRKRDLSPMPTDGFTVAAFLIEAREAGATLEQLKLAARGIRFWHEINERFLDQLPINAALRYARQAA